MLNWILNNIFKVIQFSVFKKLLHSMGALSITLKPINLIWHEKSCLFKKRLCLLYECCYLYYFVEILLPPTVLKMLPLYICSMKWYSNHINLQQQHQKYYQNMTALFMSFSFFYKFLFLISCNFSLENFCCNIHEHVFCCVSDLFLCYFVKFYCFLKSSQLFSIHSR